MNKQEVLELVDSIMHEFASSYREDARKLVEEKLKSPNKTHDAISLMDKLYHRYHKMIGCDMLYPDFEHALVEWQKQHHA